MMSGKNKKKDPAAKQNVPSSLISVSTSEKMVSISINGYKALALKIDHDLTLDKLRIEIGKRTTQIKEDYQFLNTKGFPITQGDEKDFRIHAIVNNQDGDIIEIQCGTKLSTMSLFQRESPTSSYELMVTTTSSSFSLDHQSKVSNSHRPDRAQWERLYFENNLLRGRCFSPDGPTVADNPVIKLKPNWQPNSYPCDNSTVQVETFNQQMTDASSTYKMYRLETIVKLPFVHSTLGNDSGKYRSSKTNTELKSTVFRYVIPRYVHLFDLTMIELEQKFLDEIDSILNESSNENKYEKLTKLFDTYGHGYAVKVLLGGEKTVIERQHIGELYGQNERQQQFKVNSEMTYNGFGLGVDLERNTTRTNIQQTLNNSSYANQSTMGGDALKVDINEWCEALKDFTTWRIIEYQQVEPLYKLLDSERQQKVQTIIDEYQQEQERQSQLASRCRTIPIELKFQENQGVFRLQTVHKHHHKLIGRLPLPKTTTILLFFYSPSHDKWYLKRLGKKERIWMPLKCVNMHNDKLKFAFNTIQTLLQTNPIPNNEIMKICQFYDDTYTNSALTKVGETIHDLAPKKHNYDN